MSIADLVDATTKFIDANNENLKPFYLDCQSRGHLNKGGEMQSNFRDSTLNRRLTR